MDCRKTIAISIQNLLDYAMQAGDLTTGARFPSRAVEGTRGHAAVRKALKESLSDSDVYEAEVPISFRLEGNTADLEVNGRIDGVLKDASGITIHEIKTTLLQLDDIEHDHNPQHWAQAKSYAYMFASQYGLDYITVRLTYYQLDEKLEKSFVDFYSIDALEEFFLPMVREFLDWQEMVLGWTDKRDKSIGTLDFPYPEFRQGQRELTDSVHNAIENRELLFAQAPTGTGKTIATLFPAIKALGEGLVSRVFYLTAKTTTRALAEKALDDMRKKGLSIRSVTLTAKEKICLSPGQACGPDTCEYAANYYGKLKKAMTETLPEEALDRYTIETAAKKHTICPFEFSLDLALWCDAIICDYNYLFDPRVYLKRFFTQRGDYCFLIDEAHNLVDRARDMYSSELSKRAFFELKQSSKLELPKIIDICNRIYKYFLDTAKNLAKEDDEESKAFYKVRRICPEDLYKLLERFTGILEDWLSRNPPVSFMELLLDTYYDSLLFMKITELYDERYVTVFDKSARDFKIKLFCADPSKLLREAMNKGRSSVLFSATLSPMNYFTWMLGGGSDARFLDIPSPFPKENLCVYVDDFISTKYKTRHTSYDDIARVVLETATAKTGNYMAFFPSFEYLNEVYYRFMGIKSGIRTLYQAPGMSEAARQEFLNEFESIGETSLVGFVVMGGVFGEGIDLTGDRLSGAIIVGVGLPQVCNERNILKRYFDEQLGTGFDYAYTYPGINRVLQAAGRVIRTENDMGVVILLDERFSYQNYRDLLPSQWSPIARASDGCSLTEVLQDFWG
ncbi:MAG TPA: helicase C-terminal domain-containing protein [Clostridia bacterium]|nr:helicase C-terminal domain-containing protein [Clostridia bacterium]